MLYAYFFMLFVLLKNITLAACCYVCLHMMTMVGRLSAAIKLLPESSLLVLQNIRRKQAAQRKRIRKRQDESAARQSARTAEEQVQHELFGEQADAGQLKQDIASDLVIMLISAVPGLICCMHACTMVHHACLLRA